MMQMSPSKTIVQYTKFFIMSIIAIDNTRLIATRIVLDNAMPPFQNYFSVNAGVISSPFNSSNSGH